MSGDVQPRKRKDKRRKKDELGVEEPRGTAAVFGEGDVLMHSYHEHGTGGHWCAKIIFFSLLAVLVTLIGLIILENRGLSELEANAVESRYSGVLDGWIEDASQDDHHDEHTLELKHQNYEEIYLDGDDEDHHDIALKHEKDNHFDENIHAEIVNEDNHSDENEVDEDDNDYNDQEDPEDNDSDNDENVEETNDDEDEQKIQYLESYEHIDYDNEDKYDLQEEEDNDDGSREDMENYIEEDDTDENESIERNLSKNNDNDEDENEIDNDNGNEDVDEDEEDKENFDEEIERIETEISDENNVENDDDNEETDKEKLEEENEDENSLEAEEIVDTPVVEHITVSSGKPFIELEDELSSEKPTDTLAEEEEYERRQKQLRLEKQEASSQKDGGNSVDDEWPGEPSDPYWRQQLDFAEEEIRQDWLD